jgi:hypothetical protein
MQRNQPESSQVQNLVQQVKTPVVIYKGEDLVIEEANQAALSIWNVGKEVLGKTFFRSPSRNAGPRLC